mgnify:CR=1 FL=1
MQSVSNHIAPARRLRRPPVTAPKMRVIILSRPFLFFGIEKEELRKKLRLSLSKNPKLAARARKQRYAGLRGKCCGTRVRGSVPQPQSSSLALPCQILVSVDGCQSLTAFGSCIHWMPAPSRRPKTPAGTVGKAQGGLPLGNPVCLWQTELFK